MGTSSQEADTVISIFPNPMNRLDVTVSSLLDPMLGRRPP
jgi:hypothetical protein